MTMNADARHGRDLLTGQDKEGSRGLGHCACEKSGVVLDSAFTKSLASERSRDITLIALVP